MAYRCLEFRGRDAGGVQVWTTAFKVSTCKCVEFRFEGLDLKVRGKTFPTPSL